uniref:glutamyl-tRNA(Gln) amidotransferase subunit C, mitochondrial-like n=1 Tax=Ciona intestinalis TaxID=7719 RepID=UPI000180BFA5|nr:glutamyl-tRNA(Gln) amidotransferase subunit C, mitochondrial-like [Ciona intestinalis]|eukprot:XP_004226097.1 glutamyl-tRNA(Gln) amidotransferase subunit C, mitochondrial-like [Ciona intestinalis]
MPAPVLARGLRSLPYLNLFIHRCFTNKAVPSSCSWKVSKTTNVKKKVNLDPETVNYIKQLSLVELDGHKEKETIEEAINFTERLHELNTDGITPMVSVLDHSSLQLRKDIPSETSQLILTNAKEVLEQYFVAPPGNIIFNSEEKNSSTKQMGTKLKHSV